MSRRSALFHASLLLVALVAGLALLGIAESGGRRVVGATDTGTAACVDAEGRHAVCGSFHRIASGSLLADQLLDAVADADRIVAFSPHSDERMNQHRYRDRPVVDPNEDPERLLTLHPDLLLVNQFLEAGRRRHLEEAGVTVFDLGPMRGVDSFLQNLVLVARLAGQEARGQRLAAGFRRRFASVASDVPATGRPRGAFVAVHGSQVYGGTRGTSFHDVLLAAGLRDAEAERYEGWPELTSEALLALDPDYLITTRGRRALLCEHPGLDTLRACRRPDGVVEVDPGIADDPGFAMLDAAEQIRDAVHGPRRPETR